MTTAEWLQLLAGISGLVGIGGGVAISWLTLKHAYAQDKPTLKVDVRSGHLLTDNGETSGPHFVFSIANIGKQDYTIVQLSIAVGRHSDGFILHKPTGTTELPYTLKPGKTCNYWVDYADLVRDTKKLTWRSHIKIRGLVQDYIGVCFSSKPYDLVLSETKLYKLKQRINSARRWVVRLLVP